MADGPTDDSESKTPPYGLKPPEAGATLAVIDRRMRSTDARALETLDRMGNLRVEVLSHLRQQDGVIAGMESKIDILLAVFATAQREASEARISATRASIAIQQTGEIALIDDEADRRKKRRELTLKIVAFAGPVIAAIAGALLAGGCP